MNVFCDVGAHDGQTLEEVLDGHGFEQVFAFEPMPAQYAHLVSRFGGTEHLELLNYGLADVTDRLPVYGTNEGMEASLYPAKVDLNPDIMTACDFLEASAFFRRFTDETVVVKLNCEGSEVAILNNLIDSGEIWKLAHVMVDFDVRKIPGMEHTERELLERFAEIGFEGFSVCDAVMIGPTHRERTAAWLRRIGL